MLVHFTPVSRNPKTGPIGVSTTERASCPDSCVLKFTVAQDGTKKPGPCYANLGPISYHWDKVSNKPDYPNVYNWSQFCAKIAALPAGQLWRHNQAGDLPAHSDGTLSASRLRLLIRANVGKRGFTYTHHKLTKINRALLARANNDGFTVNVSADSPYQAVEVFEHFKLPTVCVLPIDAPNDQTILTEDGTSVRVVACPAEKSDKVTCATCALCADAKRDYIIGFRAHGSRKKAANLIATQTI